MTIVQPHIMEAASSAIHLISHPPHQPSTSSAIHLISHPPHQPSTSSAIHLISHPPHQQTWALRVPTLISCYSGLVYIIDAPFRLQDWCIRTLSPSQIGCWLYAPLYLLPGFVPHFPHVDSCLSYRLSPLRVPIVYQYHSLMLLRPISSSLFGLYFLSSIIISPVSFPACMLEPLNFDPTHLLWPLMLEPSINPWILS